MHARVVLVMIFGATVALGCSHKDRYDNARAIFADDIETVAVYAPLLDAATIPASNARDVIVRIASNAGADQICQRTRLKFPPPSTDVVDVSGRISTIFATLQKSCCDHVDHPDLAPEAATQLAQQCKESVDKADVDLASIDAEAVKIGVPAHTIPRIDTAAAQAADVLDRDLVAAILLEAAPTAEETKFDAVWKDPEARAVVLLSSCEAALNADRARVPTDPKGLAYVAATDVQRARADFTGKQCAIVKSYQALAREQMSDVQAAKKSGPNPAGDADFCQRWKNVYDPAQAPAAVASLITAIQARCK
ncbi:MAG: hypothetical protein ABI183_24085 [Polyangiaceae bacterium]